jgi:hypothetical protein
MLAAYFLETGTGDASLSVGVDGFGAFGSSIGSDAANAMYDPVGAAGPSGTTYESAVAIRVGDAGPRAFLTSGNMDNSGGLSNPTVTGDSTTGTSSFTVGDLSFDLVQTVAPLLDNTATQTGSFLRQTYTIANTGTSTTDFELVRYIDGDLQFDGSIEDGGGRLTSPSEILFETDAGGTGSTDTTFVGITATGGTEPATNRFEIDSFAGVRSRIISGAALDDTVTGDGDADGFIDSGSEYDVTMALRNVYVLAPGESATFETKTLFGTGAPEDVGGLEASIDIMPDSDRNPINLANRGVIPISILTTDDFDASTVNVGTVEFAGATAFHSALEDVDDDGDLDLVLQFRTQETDLLDRYRDRVMADLADGDLDSSRQELEVSLTGKTLDGEGFQGTDTVDLFLAGRSLRDFLDTLP